MTRATWFILYLFALSAESALAGAWTLPAGKTWAKVTYFQQQADEWYTANAEFSGRLYDAGTRRPYRFGGEYESKAVFIEGFVGITDRLDFGMQIPYFDQKFSDDTRLEPGCCRLQRSAAAGEIQAHGETRNGHTENGRQVGDG